MGGSTARGAPRQGRVCGSTAIGAPRQGRGGREHGKGLQDRAAGPKAVGYMGIRGIKGWGVGKTRGMFIQWNYEGISPETEHGKSEGIKKPVYKPLLYLFNVQQRMTEEGITKTGGAYATGHEMQR